MQQMHVNGAPSCGTFTKGQIHSGPHMHGGVEGPRGKDNCSLCTQGVWDGGVARCAVESPSVHWGAQRHKPPKLLWGSAASLHPS